MPYRLETRVTIPAALDTVFDFFSDARNLQAITPPFLKFRVLTPDVAMQKGARIDYRLRLRGVPFTWQSEITSWEPGVRFRDEQRRGPYKYWKHVHLFMADDEGTLVEDGVDYDVPGGRYVHDWFVAPELMRIFTYRQHKLQEIFGQSRRNGVKVAIQIKL
jgi:ligand-binding SRPBCC domain-containing protein